jgi:hypothetical protein
MTPLERRNCGACTVCCVALKIATPELHKKAGTPCRHLSSAGCGIYADRPSVCREFLCGWRLFAELDDDWRPDRNGVLVMRKAPAELPPAWRGAPYGVHMIIIGGEAAAAHPSLVAYVARLMRQNIPVFLSAGSPSTLVNEHLNQAMAGDLAALGDKLRTLYALLHAARWERGLLRMIPALYRLQVAR